MKKAFKVFKMIAASIIGSIIVLSIAVYIFFQKAPQIGGVVDENRQTSYTTSDNYRNSRFLNSVETDMTMPPINALWEAMTGSDKKDPNHIITSSEFNKSDFNKANSDSTYKVSWFGHSSVLLQIDQQNFLIDPVFSKRVSMFSFMGPKRYDYTMHVTVADMPVIDAVLISHDHYDHLDYKTFMELKTRVNKYYVPLGVGVHLEAWGIPSELINELDWWDEIAFNESVKLAFTPSRHFSGRGIRDRFTTLWGAWVIEGKHNKLFFGGDSGYFDGFKAIGDKYGPFDFAMLECGQYNKYWPNIHMMPEETAQAGTDLRAKNVMPIHWGKFTLSTHNWQEPVKRFLKAADNLEYNTIVPELNTTFRVTDSSMVANWWKE